MSISLTPDTPLNQVRLNIGDASGEFMDDAVITYLLTANDNDVQKVSRLALKAILKDLAKLRDEATDEVAVKWSQVYDHYWQIYKDSTRSAALSVEGGAFWFGGTSKTENDKFYNDSDRVGCPIRNGFVSRVDTFSPNCNDPFSLDKN